MQKTKLTRIKKKISSKSKFDILFCRLFPSLYSGFKTYLLFVFPFVFRVKAFNAIPYYRDKVYDPDPDGSYTKAKLERLKCSSETEQNVLGQTSLNCTCFDSFPPDESNLFWKTFLFCHPLCLWMLSNKLKIRESHQRNLQTLKLL